ncbi:placenta-specific gene 8 protein-like [Engraulis encrasicolus]|uniref:placenta-specific gene 8 protein-like n=1 Tax=Engraulis encrasicolus TaxID=184585 RepID=UPI002FD0E955
MSAAVTVIQQQPLMSGSNVWSTGLCDIFDDMEIFCCAVWCYPCLFCRTLKEFDENNCLCCIDGGAPSPVHLALRYGVRKQYGIQGTLCSDWCKVLFCNECSMCQVAREIKRRKGQQATIVVNVQPAAVPMQSTAYPGHPGAQHTH